MINLSLFPKISQDLISSAINVDYLLHIKIPNNDIYIATQGQTFDAGDTAVYWEDKDLNVSAINEKINIDSKKIYISNTSITLNNYKVSEVRISDILSDGFGVMMDLYIKTPSCQSIDDCMKMANLRIVRLDHDDKKVKISAEDAAQQGFYIDLPRIDNILTEDQTFEFYVDKPVPILYGHLKSAPAIVYIDNYDANENIYENNSITLLPDNSYLEDGIDIVGIKNFGGSNLYSGMSDPGFIDSTLLELVDNDIVKISIGDIACSVNCFPYYNYVESILDKFKNNNYAGYYPQYESNQDHVSLVSKYEGTDTLLKNQALWTHTTSKMISNKGSIIGCYSSYPASSTSSAGYYYTPAQESGNRLRFGNIDYKLHTRSLIQEADDPTGLLPLSLKYFEHKMASETLSFEPLSGAEVYSEYKSDGTDENYPIDIHFTGNFSIELDSIHQVGNNDWNACALLTYGYPSGITLNDFYEKELGFSAGDPDPDNPNLGSSDICFPSEVAEDFTHNNWEGYYLGSNYLDENISLFMSFPEEIEDEDGDVVSEEKDNSFFRKSYYYPTSTQDDLFDSVANSTNYMSYFNLKNFATDVSLFRRKEDFPEDSTANNFNLLNANEITFYYMVDPFGRNVSQNTSSSTASAYYELKTKYDNTSLRRVWAEKDVFSKDFFLNAKGRMGSDVQDDNYSSVSGIMEVKYEGDATESNIGDLEKEHKENKHLNLLYYTLTEGEKRKLIDNEPHELMLVTRHNGELSFLYDVELLDIKHTFDLPFSSEINQSNLIYDGDSNSLINHTIGWNINFSAKTFGSFHTENINGVQYEILKNADIVYGKKNYTYSGDKLIVSSIDISESVGFGFGGANGLPSNANYINDDYYHGYTTIYFNQENKSNSDHLLEKPPEILKNLIQTEISPSAEDFDSAKFSQALIADKNINFGLSINEVRSSREIIENMCSQSRMMFRYRPRDNKPIVETIKNIYTNSDVSKTIDSENMLSFSYSKTKFEDLCIGGCIVKYGKNYVNDSLAKETAKKELDPDMLNAYKQYYSISDERNYVLEVEAPYIQDEASAIQLRDYLFDLNKNQHLTCKFKLSIRDGLEIEAGDVIKFSKDPIDVKPYGNSITSFSTKIDQTIYPYFLITSVSKKETDVSIEAYQLHQLNPQQLETTILGDINLDGEVNYHDRDLLLSYVLGNSTLSEQQFLNADINGDNNIDMFDVAAIDDLPNYDPVPEQEHIDDVFEQLRDRLNPVLETGNLELEPVFGGSSFPYNTQYDPNFYFTHNSYIDEEPFPEISLEISRIKYIVTNSSTNEIVEEFESDAYINSNPTTFEWDKSNLIDGQVYSVRCQVIANAVEYGYYGEQRELVSDLSSEIDFIITDDAPYVVPVLTINGQENSGQVLPFNANEVLSFSGANSFFESQFGTTYEDVGEITNYHFHCVYLYDSIGGGFLTPGNIVFSQNQDTPDFQAFLQSPGRYMCFLWMESPNNVEYDQYNPTHIIQIDILP
jgi:hypothetical protein